MSQGMLVIRLNNYLRYVSIHSIISLIRCLASNMFLNLENITLNKIKVSETGK